MNKELRPYDRLIRNLADSTPMYEVKTFEKGDILGLTPKYKYDDIKTGDIFVDDDGNKYTVFGKEKQVMSYGIYVMDHKEHTTYFTIAYMPRTNIFQMRKSL